MYPGMELLGNMVALVYQQCWDIINLNNIILTKEIESIMKYLSRKKNLRQDSLTGEFYQMF